MSHIFFINIYAVYVDMKHRVQYAQYSLTTEIIIYWEAAVAAERIRGEEALKIQREVRDLTMKAIVDQLLEEKEKMIKAAGNEKEAVERERMRGEASLEAALKRERLMEKEDRATDWEMWEREREMWRRIAENERDFGERLSKRSREAVLEGPFG